MRPRTGGSRLARTRALRVLLQTSRNPPPRLHVAASSSSYPAEMASRLLSCRAYCLAGVWLVHHEDMFYLESQSKEELDTSFEHERFCGVLKDHRFTIAPSSIVEAKSTAFYSILGDAAVGSLAFDSSGLQCTTDEWMQYNSSTQTKRFPSTLALRSAICSLLFVALGGA